jgi:hypothetical protein
VKPACPDLGLAGGVLAVALALFVPTPDSAVAAATRFVGPTASQPLALTADDAFLVVANTDSHSISFFDLRNERNRSSTPPPTRW